MKNLKTKLSQFFILFCGIMICLSCTNNQNTDSNKTENELFTNQTINVGYISYPPGFIVNPNTQEKSGIFNDIMVEIANRNHLKINYKEEVTWATMIEVLNTDRVDLICNPVWATKERKANADFSNPVYYSPIGAFVRIDDNRFDKDISKINNSDVKIAAVDGEINNVIGVTDFPKAKLISFPNNIDVAQLFLEVESKREDVTFAEPMFAFDYMQKNPGKLKNIAINTPLRNYPNCYMYKKGQTKLGAFLNTEIQKLIEDGTIEKIIAKYEPFPGAIINVKDARAKDIQ
ncbi:MAG: transporter substrate-binding domain-containing protein [Alphaproteobacteria bacterium]|nr:transporter substrate-binding domain-containing protein [Alphaproteobacteria bacterium]